MTHAGVQVQGGAAAVRPRGFDSHAGPSLEDYRAAGKELAAAVGQEGLPLVEEAVAFDVAPGANIALFALVDFKAERSLGLLEKSFSRFGSVRGHGLLAAALNDFGPKGVELAKKIPAPDPNMENFDSRAGRHGRVSTAPCRSGWNHRGSMRG